MNELALFAGAGGGILGGQILGWRTVCAVENEPYAASVLLARQNDGLLPTFPIWDDVRTFDGYPWRGIVDVVSGGFPCQDISVAGKGAGIVKGKQSSLWLEMARIIWEVRPYFVFVENTPALTSRGLGKVLGDLAEMGFDARWGVLGARDVGAPHKRERIWIVAYTEHLRRGEPDTRVDAKRKSLYQAKREKGAFRTRPSGEDMAHPARKGLPNGKGWGSVGKCERNRTTYNNSCGNREKSRWSSEPSVGRMVDGLAGGVDRLKAIGNGQVPQCAAEAWRLLTDELT